MLQQARTLQDFRAIMGEINRLAVQRRKNTEKEIEATRSLANRSLTSLRNGLDNDLDRDTIVERLSNAESAVQRSGSQIQIEEFQRLRDQVNGNLPQNPPLPPVNNPIPPIFECLKMALIDLKEAIIQKSQQILTSNSPNLQTSPIIPAINDLMQPKYLDRMYNKIEVQPGAFVFHEVNDAQEVAEVVDKRIRAMFERVA